jgi:hypothetical protein
MVADRAYCPRLHNPPNGRTNLLCFAAAVPTVGFVHGTADLNPDNAAALEGYADSHFINRAHTPHLFSKRWPLALRWHV